MEFKNGRIDFKFVIVGDKGRREYSGTLAIVGIGIKFIGSFHRGKTEKEDVNLRNDDHFREIRRA